MNESNEKEFIKIMMGLADNFGGNVSPEGLGARFEALSEYSMEQVSRAGNWLIRSRKKTFPAMPMVSEFIEAIEARESPQVSLKSRADIQVDIVLKKLRYEGRNAAIDFEDPITFNLMTTRWRYTSWAGEVMEKELTWFKKEFIEAYQAYGENEAAQKMFLSAPGKVKAIDEFQKLALGSIDGEVIYNEFKR